MRLVNADDILSRAHDVTLKNGAKHRRFDVTMLHEIPTVEAPVWIPVKEKLPDCNMMCLVSVYSPKFNDCFVTKAGYLTDLAEWDPDQTEHISCWIVITEDFQYYIMDNVVAWMPFPKPYEEVTE